jgi:hypothetical protein
MTKSDNEPTREPVDLTSKTRGFSSRKKLILNPCRLQFKRIDPQTLTHIPSFNSEYQNINYWKMLNSSVLETLFKEANIVIWHWSLFSQFLKSLKNVIFNFQFSIFDFLNHCLGAPVSITYDLFMNNIVSEYDYESKHLS